MNLPFEIRPYDSKVLTKRPLSRPLCTPPPHPLFFSSSSSLDEEKLALTFQLVHCHFIVFLIETRNHSLSCTYVLEPLCCCTTPTNCCHYFKLSLVSLSLMALFYRDEMELSSSTFLWVTVTVSRITIEILHVVIKFFNIVIVRCMSLQAKNWSHKPSTEYIINKSGLFGWRTRSGDQVKRKLADNHQADPFIPLESLSDL